MPGRRAQPGSQVAWKPYGTRWGIATVATGGKPLQDPVTDPFQLGHAAATCLARAIARAVYLARAEPFDLQPSWQSRFGT